MKPKFILIPFFLIVMVLGLSNGVSSTDNWVCQIEKEYPMEESKPLVFFKKNLLLPSGYHKFDYDLEECKKLEGELRFVGLCQNKKIFDVLCDLHDDIHNIIKMVIVERDKDMYSPVFICLFSKDVGEVLPTTIVKTDFNNTILSIRNHYDGTGNFFDETYFLLDCYPPTKLNLDKAFWNTLKKALPNGYGIRKGGQISNLKTLTYNSPVWKDKDSNGGPTGGWITIHYRIKDGNFTVLDYKYDKDKLWE